MDYQCAFIVPVELDTPKNVCCTRQSCTMFCCLVTLPMEVQIESYFYAQVELN